LDEGIGDWTGVITVGSDAQYACDATEHYLNCRPAGRAEPALASQMDRFAKRVQVTLIWQP
jgi:hypothetical protein